MQMCDLQSLVNIVCDTALDKLVRERCGLGLKEAKDLVEDEFIRLGYSFREYAEAPVKYSWE